MDRRVVTLCFAGLLLGGVGLAGCAPASLEPEIAEDADTWIEVTVQVDPAAEPVRVRAFPKEQGAQGASVEATTTGQYRMGPLPPGDYDIVVHSVNGYDTIHNYPAVSVTTKMGEPVMLDLAQPGGSAATVGFTAPQPPGVMVTAVTVLDGALKIDSHATFSALYKARHAWRRSRNTIGAEDPETTFEGLAPGPYTVCATVNLGGSDLDVTCDAFDVTEAEPADIALDIEALAGRYSA